MALSSRWLVRPVPLLSFVVTGEIGNAVRKAIRLAAIECLCELEAVFVVPHALPLQVLISFRAPEEFSQGYLLEIADRSCGRQQFPSAAREGRKGGEALGEFLVDRG